MLKVKLLVATLCLVVAGCGQKGPLLVKPEAPQNAEESQKDKADQES